MKYISLQKKDKNGNSRNYYYKEYANGEKKRISKNEYLQKGGAPPPSMLMAVNPKQNPINKYLTNKGTIEEAIDFYVSLSNQGKEKEYNKILNSNNPKKNQLIEMFAPKWKPPNNWVKFNNVSQPYPNNKINLSFNLEPYLPLERYKWYKINNLLSIMETGSIVMPGSSNDCAFSSISEAFHQVNNKVPRGENGVKFLREITGVKPGVMATTNDILKLYDKPNQNPYNNFLKENGISLIYFYNANPINNNFGKKGKLKPFCQIIPNNTFYQNNKNNFKIIDINSKKVILLFNQHSNNYGAPSGKGVQHFMLLGFNNPQTKKTQYYIDLTNTYQKNIINNILKQGDCEFQF